MTWVRRQQPEHTCKPPTAEVRGPIPQPPGAIGDLWRCDDCQKLWRVADMNESVRGRHVINMKTWETATLWQRIRYHNTLDTIRPQDIWPEDYELPPPVSEPPPPGHKAPPDLFWITTETISGSGKRSKPHLLEPPRQTGTDWLYTEREDGKTG